MELEKSIKVLLWILAASQILSDAFIIHYTEDHHNETSDADLDGSISCACNGRKITRKLSEDSLDKTFEGIRNHNFCNQEYEADVCDLLRECTNCTAESQTCVPIANTTSYQCHRKRFKKLEKYLININPNVEENSIPREGRKLRETGSCRYPEGLKTADLVCCRSKNSTVCQEKCIDGHTLKEGNTRTVRCLHAENEWKPFKIEECKIFVGCLVRLKHLGSIRCIQDTTRTCRISCDESNGNPAVSENTYECQLDGIWKPDLPFCVTASPSHDLVEAPEFENPLLEENIEECKEMKANGNSTK